MITHLTFCERPDPRRHNVCVALNGTTTRISEADKVDVVGVVWSVCAPSAPQRRALQQIATRCAENGGAIHYGAGLEFLSPVRPA